MAALRNLYSLSHKLDSDDRSTICSPKYGVNRENGRLRNSTVTKNAKQPGRPINVTVAKPKRLRMLSIHMGYLQKFPFWTEDEFFSRRGWLRSLAWLPVGFASGATERVDINLGGGCCGGLFPTATVGTTITGFSATLLISLCLFVEERGT